MNVGDLIAYLKRFPRDHQVLIGAWGGITSHPIARIDEDATSNAVHLLPPSHYGVPDKYDPVSAPLL